MGYSCTASLSSSLLTLKAQSATDQVGQSDLRLYFLPRLTKKDDIVDQNACQPGLSACGASLSLPGKLVLSDLIGADRLVTVVKQHHIVHKACVATCV